MQVTDPSVDTILTSVKTRTGQRKTGCYPLRRYHFWLTDLLLNVSYVLRDNVLCAGGNSKIFCQLLDSGGNGRRRIGFGGLLFDQRFDCLRTLQPVAVLQGMSVVRCVGMPFNSDLLSRRHIRNLNLREALPGVTRVGSPALRAWFFLSGARLIVLQEAASEDFPLVSINKFPGTPSRLNV